METIIKATEVKATEKAILLNCLVCWGDGNAKEKEIWFPKSVINGKINEETYNIKAWFCDKLSEQNAFKGYRMKIDCTTF